MGVRKLRGRARGISSPVGLEVVIDGVGLTLQHPDINSAHSGHIDISGYGSTSSLGSAHGWRARITFISTSNKGAELADSQNREPLEKEAFPW